MIVMLISDESKTERKYMVHYAKDFAGRWSEEVWKMHQCASIQELHKFVEEEVKTDILCIDLTMKGALELTKELRRQSPSAYIILIASTSILPTVYMRPTIGAESLMLKPLSEAQIQEVFAEAIQTYIRRFYSPDEKKVFVLEAKGGRELVDYENIYFFESREKRVYLNTNTEEYGFYDTLEHLEEQLSDMFLRCHRSYLVNKSKIESVFLSQNRMVLKGRFEIPLSRSYKPMVKEYVAGRNTERERI